MLHQNSALPSFIHFVVKFECNWRRNVRWRLWLKKNDEGNLWYPLSRCFFEWMREKKRQAFILLSFSIMYLRFWSREVTHSITSFTLFVSIFFTSWSRETILVPDLGVHIRLFSPAFWWCLFSCRFVSFFTARWTGERNGSEKTNRLDSLSFILQSLLFRCFWFKHFLCLCSAFDSGSFVVLSWITRCCRPVFFGAYLVSCRERKLAPVSSGALQYSWWESHCKESENEERNCSKRKTRSLDWKETYRDHRWHHYYYCPDYQFIVVSRQQRQRRKCLFVCSLQCHFSSSVNYYQSCLEAQYDQWIQDASLLCMEES